MSGSVSGSGTGSLDSQSKDPVPDPEPVLQGMSRGSGNAFQFVFFDNIIRPAKSPDLGQRLPAFSLLYRLSGFHVKSLAILKRPRGRAVSASDFGSRGSGFESRWRRDSSRT